MTTLVRVTIGRSLLAACAIAATSPVCPQVVYSESYPDNYPPPLPRRQGPQPPPIVLEWSGEVPIPGPLRSGPLAARGDEVIVPTGDGTAHVSFAGDGAVGLFAGETPSPGLDPLAWVITPDGRHRCRTTSEGGVLVETRRREGSKWRKAWRLATSSPLSAPPIPIGRRLVLLTAEGRVTAVRLSNGHRLWSTDLGERLSGAPALWSGSFPSQEVVSDDERPSYALLLLVPDSGTAILALDVYDGRVLARGTVPEGRGRLVSSALLLPDGRIAAARQGYALEDAGLALFRIRDGEKPAAADGPSAVPYNGSDLRSISPNRR